MASLRIELGVLRVRRRDLDGARRDFESVPETDEQAPLARYNLGCVHALRAAADPGREAEEKDLAFQDLSRAIDMGFRDAELLTNDADLAGLRRDPRWAPLAARLRK